MNRLEMNTIKELEKYYRLKHKSIPNLKNKLIYLENELEGVQAMEITDMPTGKGNKPNYRVEKLLDEKVQVDKRLENNKMFVEYMEKALDKLCPTDKGLLIECYAKDKRERITDSAICKKLFISTSTYYRRKREVIREFTIELQGM